MNERPNEERRANTQANAMTAIMLAGLLLTPTLMLARKDNRCSFQASLGAGLERVTPDDIAGDPQRYVDQAVEVSGSGRLVSRTVESRKETSGVPSMGLSGGGMVTVNVNILRRTYVMNGQPVDLVVENGTRFAGTSNLDKAYSEPEPDHDRLKVTGCLQDRDDGQLVLTAYKLGSQ